MHGKWDRMTCVICGKPQKHPWVLGQGHAICSGELKTLWKIYTHITKLRKKPDNSIKKGAKDVNKHMTQEDMQLTDKHKKLFNLISHHDTNENG